MALRRDVGREILELLVPLKVLRGRRGQVPSVLVQGWQKIDRSGPRRDGIDLREELAKDQASATKVIDLLHGHLSVVVSVNNCHDVGSALLPLQAHALIHHWSQLRRGKVAAAIGIVLQDGARRAVHRQVDAGKTLCYVQVVAGLAAILGEDQVHQLHAHSAIRLGDPREGLALLEERAPELCDPAGKRYHLCQLIQEELLAALLLERKLHHAGLVHEDARAGNVREHAYHGQAKGCHGCRPHCDE
mmetsp:Transcript_21296/g.45311  ORF Transcript_21296/g.45311 Transcript_21296/m.45311 type:complete len:246 (-) Transcript_21296:23-760(-)